MWLASAFCHVSSGATPSALLSSLSPLSHSLVPRALQTGKRLLLPKPDGHSCNSGAFARSIFRRFGVAACAGSDGSDMVPEDVVPLLRAVYAAKPTPQVCVTTTGSGGHALSWLVGVPGASACLLEATVPYSFVACDEKMAAGPPAPGYCSREAAEGLARDAYKRAVALCVGGSDAGPHALPDRLVIGVGCTATVASSRPHKGLHRCFVCAQTRNGLAHYQLTLAKGLRDRGGEDNAVSRVLLQAIAESAGVVVPLPFKADHLFLNTGGRESDHVSGVGAAPEVIPVGELVPEPDAVEELLEGRAESVLIVPRDSRCDSGDGFPLGGGAGTADDGDETPGSAVFRDGAVEAALPRGATVILPGSYNPLHRGHLGLLEAARALHSEKLETAAGIFGRGTAGVEGGVASKTRKGGAVRAVFEVSVSNADKGGLTAGEVRRRTRQFSEAGGVGWPYPVIVTRAPLFSQKARLFPGCAFVVGADTAKRIVDKKYYGDSQVEMVAALAEIRHLGCSFIVGGRAGTGGRFLTLEDVLEGSGLPDSVRGMFNGLDEAAFREDLSSTSIRAGSAEAGK